MIYDLFAKNKLVILKQQNLTTHHQRNFVVFRQVWDNQKEKYSGLQQSTNSGPEDNFVETVSEDGLLTVLFGT